MSSTSTQTIFSRAVKHHLHDSFVSLLDRIDEFNLGAVFTYHEKYHFWAFWRKKELDFTGAQLSDLLAKGDGSDEAGLVFKSETKTLFDATSDSSQRTVDIDLDLDGEVKAAVIDLGGDVGGSGKKIAKISVALGSVDHITSNMYEAIVGSKLASNLEHPIIREAMDKGRTLFVISSIYRSDKVDITVSREEDASVKAKEKLGDEPSDTTSKTEDKPTDTTAKTDGTDGTGTTTGDTTTSTSGGEATASGGVESAIENVVGKAENLGKDLVTEGAGIPEGNEDLSGGFSAKTTGITVTKRDRQSNIGFSVLRLEIQKDGSLSPQAKIGVSFDHKIHASYGDAFLASSGATAGDDSNNQRGLEPPSTEDGKDTPKQEDDGKDKPKEEDSKDTPKEDGKDTPKEGNSDETPKEEDGKDTPKEEGDTTNDKDDTATD